MVHDKKQNLLLLLFGLASIWTCVFFSLVCSVSLRSLDINRCGESFTAFLIHKKNEISREGNRSILWRINRTNTFDPISDIIRFVINPREMTCITRIDETIKCNRKHFTTTTCHWSISVNGKIAIVCWVQFLAAAQREEIPV